MDKTFREHLEKEVKVEIELEITIPTPQEVEVGIEIMTGPVIQDKEHYCMKEMSLDPDPTPG